MFELTSPWNKIVCDYSDTRIHFIGARNLDTLKEVNIYDMNILEMEKMEMVGIDRPNTYELNDLNQLIEWIGTLNPSEHEGVVVCDSNFRRVKIKNPAYVVAHKLKSTIGASPRNMLSAILLGKDDDIISLLPKELADDLIKMKSKLTEVIKNYDLIYDTIMKMSPASKKEFALIAQKQGGWTAPFYQIYDKKVENMRDFIEKNKEDNGSFGDSFLDKLLEIIKE